MTEHKYVQGGASYTRTREIAKKKCKFQPKSEILFFILAYPDSLPIIICEISGKEHQLDFELNAVLHFNFQNHFYYDLLDTCAVVNLGDNGNCHFYGKAVSKRLKTAGY
jgi:hypothetical protein